MSLTVISYLECWTLPHTGSRGKDTGSRWGSRRQCWTSRKWRRQWRCFCWVSRRKHRLRWVLRWEGIFFLFLDRQRSANGCNGWTIINRTYTTQNRAESNILTYHASPVSEVRDKEVTPGQTVISLRDENKIIKLLQFSQRIFLCCNEWKRMKRNE